MTVRKSRNPLVLISIVLMAGSGLPAWGGSSQQEKSKVGMVLNPGITLSKDHWAM